MILSFARQCACALALVGLIVAVAAPLSAQSLPITLAQYDRVLSNAEAGALNAASGDEEGQRQAETAISAVVRIVVRSRPNVLVFVDNRIILAQMQHADTDGGGYGDRHWTQIADELQQIRAALPFSSEADLSTSVAETQAKAVLSTQKFASEPIVTNTAWERVEEWLDAQWRAFSKLFKRSSAPRAPSWVSKVVPETILIVLIAVAFGLIVYFVVTTIQNRSARILMQSADSGLALTSEERDLVATHNYSRLRHLADEAARASDYRSAFRLTFLATLVYLNSEGAIRLDRSRTNWEYLRSLSEHPAVRNELRPAVASFDRIWYGYQDAAETDYERAVATYETIRLIVNDSQPASDPLSRRGKREGAVSLR